MIIDDRYGIRDLPEYESYHECEKKLLRVPGLKMRVDELRNDLYNLNKEKPADGFLNASRYLREKYEDILSMPEAKNYLRAEARLEKRLRAYCSMTVLAADMYYPGKTENG
jgi:hypothetical protein